MKTITQTLLLFLFSLMTITNTWACTTAVISGKYTPDGRPMLWKHRDSDSYQNQMRLFTDGKYNYVGLTNSDDLHGTQVWGGHNAMGFAIMNSASYNLRNNKNTKFKDQEGFIMKKALQSCKTISDFEHLLKKLPKPMGLEANFGVIDAQGGAAYFETSDKGYVKFDANDKQYAPGGYIIRSNYSFTGRPNQGYGYIRYMNAQKLFTQASATNQLTPAFLIKNMCRSLNNGLTQVDVKKLQNLPANQAHFVNVQDCINRYISTSSFVIQGVQPNEDVKLTTMWTLLGFPPASVAIPVWALKEAGLPQVLSAQGAENAELCSKTLKLKKQFFPIKRGAGNDYLNTTAAYNSDNTGIIQQLSPVEDQILFLSQKKIEKWRQKGINTNEMKALYLEIDKLVEQNYMQLFKI